MFKSFLAFVATIDDRLIGWGIGLLEWMASCYERIAQSTHKRYILLFVVIASVQLRANIEVVEFIFGFETPQWGWNLIISICVAIGVGWVHLLREIPHNEPDRSRAR